MLARFNKGPAALGQPRWPESRIGGSMAAMKRVFLAAALLAALSGMAQAQDHFDIYAHHCSKDDAPEIVELRTTDKGILLWNGTPTTAQLLDSYLNDAATRFIPKSENIYFFYGDKKHPPRPDIIAAMKKYGIIRRLGCRRPVAIP